MRPTRPQHKTAAQRFMLLATIVATGMSIDSATARHYSNYENFGSNLHSTRYSYYGPLYDTQQTVIDIQKVTVGRPSPDTYNALRDMFVNYEESKSLGADIELNKRELLANDIIMAAKKKEYDEGLIAPRLFKPSRHFFSVLDDIRSSQLFHYLQNMPKGGVLHAHDVALCTTDFLIELTYRPNLWVCQRSSGDFNVVELLFAKAHPVATEANDCAWQLLSTVRSERGDDAVDTYLREHLTLYPTEKFEDANNAWDSFMQIFGLLDGLILYAPAWADYYYKALEEFHADGVQYMEIRTTLPILYDMDNNVYTTNDTVRIYKETLDKFKAAHPDFIGSKLIYAPRRSVDADDVTQYIKTCTEIKELYPDFVAGFDLVGQEDSGRPLKDFIPQLLTMPKHIDFYFHAGETNWFGTSIDENLIDAVLLGTKRIGHGFALVKHPMILNMLKDRNIAIEVNPISNQVLQLVSDYRNHPCSHFFADNYPVVISSDDPSFWKASPLSHDYYIAFLGIASVQSDLRLLKKLIINSFEYSSMNVDQKTAALAQWQRQWDEYIEYVVTGSKSSSASSFGINRLD